MYYIKLGSAAVVSYLIISSLLLGFVTWDIFYIGTMKEWAGPARLLYLFIGSIWTAFFCLEFGYRHYMQEDSWRTTSEIPSTHFKNNSKKAKLFLYKK